MSRDAECTTGVANVLRFDKCGGVYVIFLVVIVAIFLYYAVMSWYLKKSMINDDLLNRKAFTFDVFPGCCSWWPVTHFVLFFIIGWFYPDCGVVAMTGGILWELVEAILGSLTPPDKVNGSTNNFEYTKWWGMSFKDIIANALGFYSAKLLRMVYENMK